MSRNDVASSAANDEVLLRVENLQTLFRTPRGLVHAVDGVSFNLSEGETLGIVGESGSGKSVLARSIMNLLPRTAVVPETSRVRFGGRDIRHLSKEESKHFWGREIGMVFQDPMTSLNPVKRIEAQITEPLRFHMGLSRREARERALGLLSRVGIPAPTKRLQQYPHELSGGMRQRITIALALACEPRLLISDEPTTALDVTVQAQILDLLADLRDERAMAGLFITHDLGVVGNQADRIGVMYAGQIVELADAPTLFDQKAHPYTEALFRSIPQLDAPRTERIDAIEGMPPDVVDPKAGCRFAPRCRYVQDVCRDVTPELRPVGDRHTVACHFPLVDVEPATSFGGPPTGVTVPPPTRGEGGAG